MATTAETGSRARDRSPGRGDEGERAENERSEWRVVWHGVPKRRPGWLWHILVAGVWHIAGGGEPYMRFLPKETGSGNWEGIVLWLPGS